MPNIRAIHVLACQVEHVIAACHVNNAQHPGNLRVQVGAVRDLSKSKVDNLVKAKAPEDVGEVFHVSFRIGASCGGGGLV